MNNFIQINDWKIKDFFKFILIIQLLFYSTIILDTIGLPFLYLRIFIAFIYLAILPGMIILRILKLHKLGNSNTLLYSIGLSIIFLMVIGLLMNLIYPLFRISRPLSTMNLIITISIAIFFLCFLSYIRDKDFFAPSEMCVSELLSTPALFLYLIPILVINGTYLVNYYHSNILLMFVILIISSVPLLITFSKFIPKNLYPLTIFIIASSLLYHRTLISPYITGYDMQFEYYFYKLVDINGFWDSSLAYNSNSVLSVTIFPAIYSNLMNMDGAFVFKTIYPVLFSFVPLGLYKVFSKQTDEKIAFLSVFYFMSIFVFFLDMTTVGKQQISEIFYMLLILTMIDDNIDSFMKVFLSVLFGTGMIFSHYGTSYFYMLISICTLSISKLILNYRNKVFTSITILRFMVFGIFWYIYNSSSSSFITVINMGERIINSIHLVFYFRSTQALKLLFETRRSLLWAIFFDLYYISQFFIFIGIISLIFSIKKGKKIIYDNEFVAFSIASFILFLLSLSIPSFRGLNIHRMYHLYTFFLAPFFIIGWINLFDKISTISSWKMIKRKYHLRILSIFLTIFLLFNSGFIFEMTNEPQVSISLSQERVKKSGNMEMINYMYTKFFMDSDVFSVRWISLRKDNQYKIYADHSRIKLIFTSYGMMINEGSLLRNNICIRDDSYVYLGYPNLRYGVMSGPNSNQEYWNIKDILILLNQKNMIYSNGGSIIYK